MDPFKLKVENIISSGILELYTAGLTSEKENKEVEQYLFQYPEIMAELASIATTVEAYAKNFAIQPATLVKEKLLKNIGFHDVNLKRNVAEPINSTRKLIQRVSPYWRITAAASIALLIGSMVLHFVNYAKYETTNRDLVATRQTLTEIEEKERNIEGSISVVQSKYSVPVTLKGLNAAPNAVAKIFWMKNTGEVYIDASNMPLAPAGKQYQLWGIVDGRPVNGGMLLKNRSDNAFQMQKMKSFGKAEAFAITLEPENGNPIPQGPMYVMGKM